MEEELESLRSRNTQLEQRVQELEGLLAQKGQEKPKSDDAAPTQTSEGITEQMADQKFAQYLASIRVTGGGDIVVTQSGPGQFHVTSR